MVHPLWRTVGNIRQNWVSASCIPGSTPNRNERLCPQKTGARVFRVALFLTTQNVNQSTCPATEGWISRWWCPSCGLLHGRGKAWAPATPVTWINVTDMMPKDKKPGSNEYTQCDFILWSSRTDKTNLWWEKSGKWEALDVWLGIDWENEWRRLLGAKSVCYLDPASDYKGVYIFFKII